MSDNAANNRVYWHSRRGMLEIDLALMPFSKEVFPGMNTTDRATYVRLLEEEDQDLFAWILQRSRPEDDALASMIDVIIEYTKKPKA
ncbi:MAG: succinate dehydrogenase assembly factor 2 [Pseudomonadales bacterium]|nr:succinate dehydrogenase assembly factor 2 [Pseudomonadales bacterium]